LGGPVGEGVAQTWRGESGGVGGKWRKKARDTRVESRGVGGKGAEVRFEISEDRRKGGRSWEVGGLFHGDIVASIQSFVKIDILGITAIPLSQYFHIDKGMVYNRIGRYMLWNRAIKTWIRYGVTAYLMATMFMSATGVLFFLHSHEAHGQKHDCQNCAICQRLTGDVKYFENSPHMFIAGNDLFRLLFIPPQQTFLSNDLLSELSPRAPPFQG